MPPGSLSLAGGGDRDDELDRVERFFRTVPDFEQRAGTALRRALDEVIDGPRTGRWDVDQLSRPEKTYIGTKVEILLRAEFDLGTGHRMDYLIDGVEVDSKFTIRRNWSIPDEAVNHIILVVSADDDKSRFSIGLVRVTDTNRNTGRNRDTKAGLNEEGRRALRWLVLEGRLPENILLHIDEETRTTIMGHTSGQRRLDELFRQVHNRPIPRGVVESVAQQRDSLRRARQSRINLRSEGIIVICETYLDQRREAEVLGLPLLGKDEWIATLAPDGWVWRDR